MLTALPATGLVGVIADLAARYGLEPGDSSAHCGRDNGHHDRDPGYRQDGRGAAFRLAPGGPLPSAVVAAVRREERAAELRERYGVQVADAAAAAKMAHTLVLAVKPQDMGRLLDEIAPVLPAGTLVISVAAGITTEFIGRRLPGQLPVVRVMSNTPVLVDEAMSVISAGAYAGEEHLRRAEELLSPVGKVLRIPESQQDAATALSGSGPAYVYYLVEAMVDAGILLGMARGAALEMVIQAVYGAATMLRESGEHPVILREAVTSPGGTTISAIRELERHGGGPRSWRPSRRPVTAAGNWRRSGAAEPGRAWL